MQMKKFVVLAGVVVLALIGVASWMLLRPVSPAMHAGGVPGRAAPAGSSAQTGVAAATPASGESAIPPAPGFVDRSSADLKAILADYRKTIVLMVDEKSLSAPDLQAAHQVGEAIFHDMHEQSDALLQRIGERFTAATPTRVGDIEALLDYIESDPSLFDADRLAFKDVLQGTQLVVAKDSTLPAIKLDKRINEDLAALEDIEHQYDQEIRQIFSRFETRAIVQKRERWDDYAAHLKSMYTRAAILKDYGVIVPYPLAATAGDRDTEFFGTDFPDKTIALTFDDGPHPQYTLEIEAILKQYGVPAVFFTVGKNLGTVDASGKVTLSPNAAISKRLVDDHFVLGNHSFTHAQLAKESGAELNDEIMKTDAVLRAVDPDRSPLFRFPFGARNKEGLQLLGIEHLQSVLWNIDSLDWADPIPNSVADRVLREVDQQHRGIILFHDIHDRAIKALPIVLDRLIADGYSFAGWDGHAFKVPNTVAAKAVVTAPDYSDSDAIVIGIDQYAKWPKLEYASRDADSIRQELIDHLGFKADHITFLKDQDATRNAILAAFHDQAGKRGSVAGSRLFVFFAGHGATRQLASGRNVGYIIPVDSDPERYDTDALAMTELQNIAENLTARHVFFVMDACYSGLGLTRGGASGGFLKDNARRVGRQMLTAGGADQQVADGGPGGHSIFTWTVLQGLRGKADLNGDGYITATELAAYVAPAVGNVSQQSPAFGSLPGSEGGEFVFELPAQTEFLSAQSSQLSPDAIALNARLDAHTDAGAAGSANGTPAGAAGSSANAAATTGASAEGSRPAAGVVVKNLDGQDRTLAPQPVISGSVRQRAQAANDHGLALYKEKKYDEAEAAFTEALRLRPGFALAANNLGFVYYQTQRYEESVRWFENTVQMEPSRGVAYLNLGDAYLKLERTDKAVQAYKTYLALNPTGPSSDYAREQLKKVGG